MKKELGCLIKGILVCFVIGLVYFIIDKLAGSPNENSIIGQLIPLISLAIIILFLKMVGVIKSDK